LVRYHCLYLKQEQQDIDPTTNRIMRPEFYTPATSNYELSTPVCIGPGQLIWNAIRATGCVSEKLQGSQNFDLFTYILSYYTDHKTLTHLLISFSLFLLIIIIVIIGKY